MHIRLLSGSQLHGGTAVVGLVVSVVSVGLAAVLFGWFKSGCTRGGRTEMKPWQRVFGMGFDGVGFGAVALVLADTEGFGLSAIS